MRTRKTLQWSATAWRSSCLIAIAASGLTLLAARLSIAATEPAKDQKPVARESKLEMQALDRKLDKVLAAQDQILQRLNAMQDELQIVKVRCTR